MSDYNNWSGRDGSTCSGIKFAEGMISVTWGGRQSFAWSIGNGSGFH